MGRDSFIRSTIRGKTSMNWTGSVCADWWKVIVIPDTTPDTGV